MKKLIVIFMVCLVTVFNCIDAKGIKNIEIIKREKSPPKPEQSPPKPEPAKHDTCIFHLDVPQYPKGRVTLEVCDWRCAEIMYNSYGECISDTCLCLPKGGEDIHKPAAPGQKDLATEMRSMYEPERTEAKEPCKDEYGGYCDDK